MQQKTYRIDTDDHKSQMLEQPTTMRLEEQSSLGQLKLANANQMGLRKQSMQRLNNDGTDSLAMLPLIYQYEAASEIQNSLTSNKEDSDVIISNLDPA